MTKGLVSIITPAYNCGKYIGEAIESVQAQTYPNWEMLIVDDCSTDDTEAVVARYMQGDSRIKYFKMPTNSGPALARNEAISRAQGQYIAFLDGDDLWEPHKLRTQLKFMRKNHYAFTATSYEHVDEDGTPLGHVMEPMAKVDYRTLLLENTVGNSTIIYDASKLGKFHAPNLWKRNDYALWLKMLKKEKYIYGMPEVLMKYRCREESISSVSLSLVKYHWILYHDIERLSVPKSIYHIGYWGVVKLLKKNFFHRKRMK